MRVTRRFRVELRGKNARLGEIPAGDVARLLLGVERVLARQAAHSVGRPAAATGRWETVIANAARVRLAAIEEGSVIPVLDLPDYGVDGLALEAQTLGEAALEEMIDIVAGQREPAPDVAAAFVSWADDLGIGARYDSVVIEHTNGAGRRRVVLDPPARDRFRRTGNRAGPHAVTALLGTLVEADFERASARLRTPEGAAVSVSFPTDLADVIEEALRQPAEFAGEVTYDPVTSTATSIRLREVHGARGLWERLESEDYWRPQSLAALERAGAVRPVGSAEELRAPGSTEGADLEAFFAAIAE